MTVRFVGLKLPPQMSRGLLAATWSVLLLFPSDLGCISSTVDEVVSAEVTGAPAVADTVEPNDGAPADVEETDSYAGLSAVDSGKDLDSLVSVDSTPLGDVGGDASPGQLDVGVRDAVDASDLWTWTDGIAYADGGVMDWDAEADTGTSDVAPTEDSDGDAGGVDIVISECGKLVSPGGLSGKNFGTCMGFPLIEKANAVAITPISTTCPSPPVVVEVTAATSVSLRDWYYINPPGWEPNDWAGAGPGGIQQMIAIDKDLVLVAGAGELTGDFYQKPAKAVFGLISGSKGVVASAQTGPSTDSHHTLRRIIELDDGSYSLVGLGSSPYSLLRIPEGLVGGDVKQTAFSYYHSVEDVAKGKSGELVLAGLGPTWDLCETIGLARISLDAVMIDQFSMGGQGYQPYLERHIVPLGGCGYGYIAPANIFTDSTTLLPVIIRMDENLNVVGLWRWNVPAPNFGGFSQGIHAATVDGDVVIATRLWVMRVDGTTGDVKWYTQLTLPAGYPSLIAGLTVLPGGKTVVSLEVSKSGPPKGKVYALLTVIGLDGCIEKHFSLEGIESDWNAPIWRLAHIVAVGDETIAGTSESYGKPHRSEVLFIDLPGAQQ